MSDGGRGNWLIAAAREREREEGRRGVPAVFLRNGHGLLARVRPSAYSTSIGSRISPTLAAAAVTYAAGVNPCYSLPQTMQRTVPGALVHTGEDAF